MSDTPTGLSITAGSIGKQRLSFFMKNVPTTNRMYSMEYMAGVSTDSLRPDSSPPLVISGYLGDLNLNSGVYCVSAWLRDEGLGLGGDGLQRRPNLSAAAQGYLERLGWGVEDLFHHVLAVLHDPAYREANAGALRMEWPRIPLPGWPDGDLPGAAEELAESAERGRELARLLDPETPVPGITVAPLRPDIASIAVPATTGGRNMAGDDFSVTAGWGHFGTGDAVMPGQGHAEERPYTAGERAALGDATNLGRVHRRRLPERPGLLAQRPHQRVELQAGRLPGAEEVAVVPGASRDWAGRCCRRRCSILSDTARRIGGILVVGRA